MNHHTSNNKNTAIEQWIFFPYTHISLFTARSKCKQVVHGPKFLLCQKTVSWVGLQMYNSYAFGAVAIKTVLGFIHLPVMPPCFSLCPSLVLFYWMESQHQTEWHFTLPFESIDEHSRDCQPLAELRYVGQEKQWPRMSYIYFCITLVTPRPLVVRAPDTHIHKYTWLSSGKCLLKDKLIQKT